MAVSKKLKNTVFKKYRFSLQTTLSMNTSASIKLHTDGMNSPLLNIMNFLRELRKNTEWTKNSFKFVNNKHKINQFPIFIYFIGIRKLVYEYPFNTKQLLYAAV